MTICKRFFSLVLLVVAFAQGGVFSEPAYAQRAGNPEIDRFFVASDNGLAAGAELTFTIEGTPRGKAIVRIGGLAKNILLKEVSRGVYEGNYTIRRTDRISPSDTLRATLKIGNRSTGETSRLSSTFGSAPLAAAAPKPAPFAAAQLAAPKIDRFTVTPIVKIEPGADLRFAIVGTSGAKAAFTIEGVAKNVPMQEVTRGNYEGSYTIRRLDHFPSTVNIFGTLEAGGQPPIGVRLNQALIVDATPPVIRNTSPRDGETIGAGNPTSISASFDDSGGVGVDASSVKVMVSGRDVTQYSKITPQFFNYRENLPPGRYSVELIAKDLAGNGMRYAWTFSVASQPPASLPLQILSHANNAQVGGGPIEIRGRTAPDARVDVQVQGLSSVAGLFGVRQQVYEQSFRADPNGNFAFSFRPQVAVPGTRYEIMLNATKADLRTEAQLVLFQQQ